MCPRTHVRAVMADCDGRQSRSVDRVQCVCSTSFVISSGKEFGFFAGERRYSRLDVPPHCRLYFTHSCVSQQPAATREC